MSSSYQSHTWQCSRWVLFLLSSSFHLRIKRSTVSALNLWIPHNPLSSDCHRMRWRLPTGEELSTQIYMTECGQRVLHLFLILSTLMIYDTWAYQGVVCTTSPLSHLVNHLLARYVFDLAAVNEWIGANLLIDLIHVNHAPISVLGVMNRTRYGGRFLMNIQEFIHTTKLTWHLADGRWSHLDGLWRCFD